jgi:hypothetical protein
VSHLRALAAMNATTRSDPPVSDHRGEITRVSGRFCALYLDGDTETEVGLTEEGAVVLPYEAHVAPLAVGQVVAVTFVGRSPRVTGRLA